MWWKKNKKEETPIVTVTQLKNRLQEVSECVERGEFGRTGSGTFVVIGTPPKGPIKNRPVIIRDYQEMRDFFGDPFEVKKKGKQIFSENDPYGEENWEE